MRALLTADPGLARERTPDGNTTGLHLAVPHVEAVRLLLQHGADPNTRDVGDNATPLHGAGRGGVEVVRALLDAMQKLVEDDPAALERRRSRFENAQTALHYVIAPPDGLLGGSFRTGSHCDMLDLLIELGADLDAMDDRGRTPLALAMLRGDDQAMRRLKVAGAKEPRPATTPDFAERVEQATARVRRSDAMIQVPDVRATVDWYQSIGFRLEGAHEIDTPEAWAGLSLGSCYIMFIPGGTRAAHHEVSLWMRTDAIDELYQLLKQRQMERASDLLAGRESRIPETRFAQDIYNAFYGERQFTIVDPNGYELHFCQEIAGRPA
jgi:hypothetical protein